MSTPRPAKATTAARFHARTVLECWHIAREQTEAYQRMANRAKSDGYRALCLAKRDAVDRLAQTIRYGRQRRRTTRRA